VHTNRRTITVSPQNITNLQSLRKPTANTGKKRSVINSVSSHIHTHTHMVPILQLHEKYWQHINLGLLGLSYASLRYQVRVFFFFFLITASTLKTQTVLETIPPYCINERNSLLNVAIIRFHIAASGLSSKHVILLLLDICLYRMIFESLLWPRLHGS